MVTEPAHHETASSSVPPTSCSELVGAPAAAAPARAPSALSIPSDLSDSSPPPLPPIPSQDRPLLLRLLALNCDYHALANELASCPPLPGSAGRGQGEGSSSLVPCSLSPVPPPDLLDLYTWSTRPDIAAWLAFHRDTKDLTLRQSALATLESLLKSDNKLEQRRAATTILRALDHRWPSYRDSWNRSRERSPGPSSRGSGSRSQAPNSEISNFKLSSPSLPLTPSITPDLQHTPTDLAAAIAIDLRDEFPMQALATIAALLSAYGPIADEETLEKRIQTPPPLSDQSHLSDPIPFTPPRPLAEGRQLTLTDPPTSTILIFKFVRFTNKPWRLFDLNSG